MSRVIWEISHSVDADASPAFAWAYQTNPANWDDPPATFALDGPFAAGTLGTTRMPGQEPRHWQIREVSPMQSFAIEMALDRATITFEWRFARLDHRRTQLMQRIALSGENAAAYVEQVQVAFASNLAPGMDKIATAMGRAEAGDLG